MQARKQPETASHPGLDVSKNPSGTSIEGAPQGAAASLELSTKAQSDFHKAVQRYNQRLWQKSKSLAEGAEADMILAIHVKDAARYLEASDPEATKENHDLRKIQRKRKYMSAIGGMLAGASFSVFLSILISGKPHEITTMALLLILLIGSCFLMAYGLLASDYRIIVTASDPEMQKVESSDQASLDGR